MIITERVYSSKSKGYRILVDRVWPRGLTKERVNADIWDKDIAPSDSLRKWFSHDPKKWPEFRSKYKKELGSDKNLEILKRIKEIEREKGKVILLFGAKDISHNQAVVLKEVLDKKE